MLDLQKSTFCLLILFLLCLPFIAFEIDNEGRLDSPIPTTPKEIPNYFLWWEILPGTVDSDSAELIVIAEKNKRVLNINASEAS
jgi:hypothetical protein